MPVPPLSTLKSAVLCLALVPALVRAAPPAEPAGDGRIYSCVDGSGKRLSADRPIPECQAKEQRMLNRDGSLRGLVQPARSMEEQSREEAAQRQRVQEAQAREESVRRDRMLLVRYPEERAHEAARLRALAPVLKSIETARNRLAKLDAESDELVTARAALAGKTVPEDLKARIGANEGALEAQRNILRKEEAERDRLNQQFDSERLRLQQLWGGAAPGSVPAVTAPSPTPGGGRGGAAQFNVLR